MRAAKTFDARSEKALHVAALKYPTLVRGNRRSR